MAFEDTLKEAWFIGVLAGVSALILILVIIIIILCCLWCRRKKGNEKGEAEQHDIDKESSTPSSYQEIAENQNWMLVQPNGITSVPASNDTPRLIKGDDPYIAGSSLVKMNEEMKRNGVLSSQSHSQNYTEMQTQTNYKLGIEKTLEQNQNIDAFERKRSDASEVSKGAWRGGRFDRESGSRESSRSSQSYQKPRIANIQVSQSKKEESSERVPYVKDRVYLPERNDSFRTSQTVVYNQTNQSYRIPEEDYEGISMYSEEDKAAWRSSVQPRQNPELNLVSDGKVKNLAGKFESTETTTQTVTSYSKTAVEDEIRELKRRSAEVGDSYPSPMSPQRTSVENQSYPGSPGPGGHHSTNWQGKSGKGTIETRVNRIKKVGAVSVFPD